MVLALAAFAWGAERPLTPAQICELELSVNARLDRLRVHPPRAPAVRVATARLMNETWWPAMVRLREIVTNQTPAQLETHLRRGAPAIKLVPRVSEEPVADLLRVATTGGYAYDHEYDREFRLDLCRLDVAAQVGSSVIHFPFFTHNRSFMERAYLATVVLARLIHAHHAELKASYPEESHRVLDVHSFTHDEADQALYFALKTYVQAFALVTATPLGGVSAEEVARRASTVRRSTSTIERLALEFPPGLFGRFGSRLFVSHAVELDAENRVVLSRKMRVLLARARDEWAARHPPRLFEFGFGCPVAFPAREKSARTGVGLGLEAFWHVYDRLQTGSG